MSNTKMSNTKMSKNMNVETKNQGIGEICNSEGEGEDESYFDILSFMTALLFGIHVIFIFVIHIFRHFYIRHFYFRPKLGES